MTLKPLPLNEEYPLLAAAVEPLREAPALAPAIEERLLKGVLEREAHANRPVLPRFWRPAFAGAVALSAAVVWLSWQPAPLAPLPGAELVRRDDGVPMLTRGAVEGRPQRRLARVATPFASVEWTQARFLFAVVNNQAVLSVSEGEVVCHTPSGSEQVHAGETVAVPGLEVPEGFAAPAPAPKEDCGGPCLERATQGSGLSAQNALFALGRFDEYLRRFPDGVLAPEASRAVLGELIHQRRYAEALDAARAYEARFPDDAFAAQVRSLRARLERINAGREAFPR